MAGDRAPEPGLLDAVRQGDEDAFGRLVEPYRSPAASAANQPGTRAEPARQLIHGRLRWFHRLPLLGSGVARSLHYQHPRNLRLLQATKAEH